jgi:TP53 regulating kinase-like protein
MEIENNEILISQGAEAKIYISDFHGKRCIIKERFSKSYRVKELDDKLTKQRILNEVRNITKLHKIGVNTPYILFVDLFQRKIYMEYISKSVLLKNILNRIYYDQFTIQKYSNLINNIINATAKYLAKIHNNNIIHGDLTSSNILLTYNNSNNIEEDILFHQEFDTFYFIDFGLSYVSQENEDKAVDLYVLRRAIISANPKSEEIFNQILEKYKIYVNNGNSIVNVLLKVEQRGRKKIAFG